MSDPAPYKITLDELEDGVRVPAEELVESAPPSSEKEADPRGPQPDANWFAAGG